MRFGLFYEHQLPRPWGPGADEQLLNDALEQIELADGLGFDHVWEVEHHFLEEYSHSSAPEVFLAAASQRTRNIRLGHGIVALPPQYNHPARVAERIATLDLLSGGRVDFGTGETSSQAELGAFGVPRAEKRTQWEESIDVVTRLLVEEPFTGHHGEHIDMPPRNLVPKPKQQPHPPLWVACSRRETIELAARKGMGALSFSFVEPEDAKPWVDRYYDLLASDQCVPAGFDVNPNLAVVVPFMLHGDEATAIERGVDGAHFFGYSLAYYYVFGQHRPGVSNVWEDFLANRTERGFARELVVPEDAPLNVKLLQGAMGSLRGAIGTPDQVADLVARYEAAGVDQIIFVGQAGHNRHEHICESIELFGRQVLPRFAEGRDERDEAKRERLAEARDAAIARRPERRDPAAVANYVIDVGGETEAARTPRFRSVTTAGDAVGHAVKAGIGGLLRKAPDEVLAKIATSAPMASVASKKIAEGLNRADLSGIEATVLWELAANGSMGGWLVEIVDGVATARTDTSGVVGDVVFKMTGADFLRITTGELTSNQAMFTGRLTIEGDQTTAMAVLAKMPADESRY